MHLRDDHNSILVRSMDDIANIDESYARATVDRRLDGAIIDIDLSSLGGGLRFLRVRHSSIIILRRDYVPCAQVSLPLQSHVVQRGLRFCLIERGLVRFWIDNGEQVARFHILPFGKIDLHQSAIHPGVNGDGVKSLHRPQAVEVNRHVLLLDFPSNDRDRSAARTSWAAATARTTRSYLRLT
jgi:hypothetical protein